MKLSGQLAENGLKPFIEETFIVGGHKMPKIWVLAADSKGVYFFRKPDHHLEKIGEAHPKEKTESELSNQSSGRVHDRMGQSRHRLEEHDESLKHGDEEFMRVLAAFLDEAARAEAFDRLVLALAPRMLGLLRPHLSKEVTIRITAELDKDLTHFNEKTLYEYLDKALWV